MPAEHRGLQIILIWPARIPNQADAAFAHVLAERTAVVPRVTPYRPGEFSLRELPSLRAVLEDLSGLDLRPISSFSAAPAVTSMLCPGCTRRTVRRAFAQAVAGRRGGRRTPGMLGIAHVSSRPRRTRGDRGAAAACRLAGDLG